MLLEQDILSEQQLAQAVSHWTIHGATSLGDHLKQVGLLSAADCDRLTKQTHKRLQQLLEELEGPLITTPDDETGLSIEQLDSSGRVATLLGVGSGPVGAEGYDSRRFTEDYTLMRKLGEGGLGKVWLARDNSLRRYVALKEVNEAAKKNENAVMRFRREAVITGRLEHPSIVPVHQFGEDIATGQTFYTMRFLGKQTMQDAIGEYHERRQAGDHDPMLLHRLLSAFVSVCQAIAYAHSKDVVHRDLKPENVALDGFGQVIVLDWGLAKLIGESELQNELQCEFSTGHDRPEKTVAGQVMGTPMYMAPEQAAGRVDEIDERTDVYGLGAILFAILTGAAPHKRSHQLLSSRSKVAELLTAIMNDPTPRAQEINPDVAPELDAVCKKALARKRYARYASASELAEDAQRWMAGEPVSVWTERWSKRVLRWVKIHRRLSQLVAVLTTVLLVASITLGIVTHQNRVTEQHTQFEAIRSQARELEIRLRSRSLTLTKNVRFMANLPPIQAIIDARNQQQTTNDENTWHERLATIFRGLLLANADYLSIAFVSVAESADEIVRVERHSADISSIRVVPTSRLGKFEKRSNLASILEMKPDDVFMIDSASVEQEGVTSGFADYTLLAATPIYEEQSGNVFGIVVIETDIEQILTFLLESATSTAANVYVTDGKGKILMHASHQRGTQTTLSGRPIASIVTELRDFFGPAQISDTMTDGGSYYALKVRLESRLESTVIGLVFTLHD